MPPTVETERDVLRARCGCGSRAILSGSEAMRAELAEWWRTSHARCPNDAEGKRRRERDRYRAKVGTVRPYRCTRCDGEGHSVRSCPMPPDPTEIDNG